MLTLRNAIAAITMAGAALCGGGKAVAEQKGTLSVSEVRAASALRSKSQRRADDVVTVVATTEVTTTERHDEARASGDDRAALNLLLSVAVHPDEKPTGDARTDQFVVQSIHFRPPTRAPPRGSVNWLAVQVDRA